MHWRYFVAFFYRFVFFLYNRFLQSTFFLSISIKWWTHDDQVNDAKAIYGKETKKERLLAPFKNKCMTIEKSHEHEIHQMTAAKWLEKKQLPTNIYTKNKVVIAKKKKKTKHNNKIAIY